jgi:hypothetical protein
MSEIQKAKNDYYRFSHAVQCFHRAKSALDKLQAHYDDPELKLLFTCAFVIYYAKPFKEGGPIIKSLRINRKDSTPDVSFRKGEDFAELFHNKIILLRDKFYAHTDLDIKEGTGNACLVESYGIDEDGNIGTNAFFITSGVSKHEIPIYQNLLEQLTEVFERKSHNVLAASAMAELRQKGYYELAQDDSERWFIRREDLNELPPAPSKVFEDSRE